MRVRGTFRRADSPLTPAPRFQIPDPGTVRSKCDDQARDDRRHVRKSKTQRPAHTTIPDVTPQQTPDGCRHGYFLYLFKLDLGRLRCTSQEFSEALSAEGVPNKARLITGGMPVYLYRIIRYRPAFPRSEYPREGRRYAKGDCPVAEDAIDLWFTMNIYEHDTETDIQEIAHGIGKVASHFHKSSGSESRTRRRRTRDARRSCVGHSRQA